MKLTKLSVTTVVRIIVKFTCLDVNIYFVPNYWNHLHIFNRRILCDSIDNYFVLVTSVSHLVIWSLRFSEFLAKLFAHEGVANIVQINEYNFLICIPHEVTGFFQVKIIIQNNKCNTDWQTLTFIHTTPINWPSPPGMVELS